MFNSKKLLNLFSKNINKDEMLAWREFYSLGTIIQLKAYGNKSEVAISEAMKRVNDIDDKMSAFKDYSELSKINRSAGKKVYTSSGIKDKFNITNTEFSYRN